MSGIYIPRLEELKCDECFWCIGYRIKCSAGNREVLLGIKHPDCPLIHVPDHGDLIDRDKLMGAKLPNNRAYQGDERISYPPTVWQILDSISKAPAIIPREEAKDG